MKLKSALMTLIFFLRIKNRDLYSLVIRPWEFTIHNQFQKGKGSILNNYILKCCNKLCYYFTKIIFYKIFCLTLYVIFLHLSI